MLDLDRTRYSGDFGGADDESELEIKKFKMADPKSGAKWKTLLDSDRTQYLGVFGGADYESEIEIQIFKMAGPI